MKAQLQWLGVLFVLSEMKAAFAHRELVALSEMKSAFAQNVLDGAQLGLGGGDVDPTPAATGAGAGAPRLRGLAQPNKLWVVNKCGSDTALYSGPKSLPLPVEYTAEGGAPYQGAAPNPSVWVDAAGISNCYSMNCNAMGRTLAELNFDQAVGGSDWIDISFVMGFNYPVKIEVLGAADVGESPRNVSCQDPACKDSFMLCDTAAANVQGGAPNWKYPSGAGLTYKVTFCDTSANTANNKNSNRDALQKTLQRYTVLPLPADKPMVWCACEYSWALNPKVFNYAKYTQFNGDLCGPVTQ